MLEDEHTVTDCVEHIGLSQGRISTHLGCPSDCGYVSVRRSGRVAYYQVADPRVADLVLLARALAADNAAALAACMRIEPATPTPDRTGLPRCLVPTTPTRHPCGPRRRRAGRVTGAVLRPTGAARRRYPSPSLWG
jgi:hypothetical protein